MAFKDIFVQKMDANEDLYPICQWIIKEMNGYLYNTTDKEDDILYHIPTNIVNLLYYTLYVSKEFGFVDMTTYIQNIISKVRTRLVSISNDKLDDVARLNNIYALTHVIIGASEFYTKPLSRSEYQMEAALLQRYLHLYKNSHNRTSVGTPDIICESALCLLLVDEPFYHNDIEWAKNLMYRQMKKSNDNILYNSINNKGDLNKNEHTNILYILLNLYKPI